MNMHPTKPEDIPNWDKLPNDCSRNAVRIWNQISTVTINDDGFFMVDFIPNPATPDAHIKLENITYPYHPPKPPQPPLSRHIIEGTYGTCPKCHSTEIRKYNLILFRVGKKIGCINPDCENYHQKTKI